MKNESVFKQLIENRTVLKNEVKLVYFDKMLGTDVLVMDLEGVKAIVVRDEVDLEVQHKSLVSFVGRDIQFVVQEMDVDHNTVICSRKEAQKQVKDSVVDSLRDGKEVEAKIINILKYGAYVEYEGVSGLLKNQDFAEDFTTIKEVKALGDVVTVRMKKVSENGKVLFEATEKYKNPTIMSLEMFQPDQVVLGTIRNIQPWGVFVCIAPGIDALCSIPQDYEIEEDMRVQFRITQVKKEEGRVRGKILRVL